MIQPLFLSRSREEWKAQLVKHNVPVDIVASIPEALDQAQQRGRLVSHPHPTAENKDIWTVGIPYRLDHTAASASRRAPLLNEHREEIISSWLTD